MRGCRLACEGREEGQGQGWHSRQERRLVTRLFKTHEDFRGSGGHWSLRVGSAGAGGRPYTCQSARLRLRESRSWSWHPAEATWHEPRAGG